MHKQAAKASKKTQQPKQASKSKVTKTLGKKTAKKTMTKQRRTMTSTTTLKRELSIHDAFVPETQRTYRQWQNKPVSPDVVKKAYDTIKFGPTAFNSSPLRIAIIQTPEAKNKFQPCLLEGNIAPMQTAPLTAVLAWDSKFNDHFDFLSPGYAGAGQYFQGNPDKVKPAAELNAHLQAGYLLSALRTQGLDLGPANGLDTESCDTALFKGNPKTESWKSFMYINIGHADTDGLFPRAPRFEFDTVSQNI